MSTFAGCKYKLLAVVAGLAVVFAACGGNNEEPVETESTSETGTSGGSGSVVIIKGKPFTCDKVIGGECNPEIQAVFDRYKENIDVFANKGGMGPYFNNSSYEDVAFAGLVACTFLDRGENAYIDFMLTDSAFSELQSIEILPVWFEAQDSLCPSGSMVAPGDFAPTP